MSFKRIFIILAALTGLTAPLFSETNTNSTVQTATNETGPQEPSEFTPGSINPSQNIIFDNYDEVIMQNYEKQNITHIKFIGNVKIRFSGDTLKARMVIITVSSNKVQDISAFEKVEFVHTGDIYLADFMSFNPDTKKGTLKNVRSFSKGGMGSAQVGPISTSKGWYYHAEKGTILSDDKIVLENTYFTFTPVEPPHYQFFSSRLWIFKGELMFALFDSYTVGNGMFFPLPFYLRWERFTGIKTAFGQELRIGWYVMNSIDVNQDYGNFSLGLDIYEKLGQYFMLDFRNKKDIGPFQTFTANFQGANDNRLSYDSVNNRYSQFVTVDDKGTRTNIQQLAWFYKINAGFNTNGLGINFNWQDINDPYFLGKYNARHYNFDIQKVLQPFQNSFYYRFDDTVSTLSLSRDFTLTYNNLNIRGSWVYSLYQDPSVSNRFLNSAWKNYLSSLSFPNISYSLPQIELFKGDYTFPVNRTVQVDSNKYTVGLDESIDPYIYPKTNETNNKPGMNVVITTNDSGSIETNLEPLSIPAETLAADKTAENTNSSSGTETKVFIITTNNLSLFTYSSYLSGSMGYNSSENLNTNRLPTSDYFNHTESGVMGINFTFLNNLFSMGNSFSFQNTKSWSTFPSVNSNYLVTSGYTVDFNNSESFSQNSVFFKDLDYEISIPFNISHSINYQVLRTSFQYQPLYMYMNSSAGTGVSLFKAFAVWNLTGTHSIQYRLTNDVVDMYIDNIMSRGIGLNTDLKVIKHTSGHWLSFATSTALNMLELKTNYFQFTFTSITNHINPGSEPRLTISFSPPSTLAPMPSASFVYDILKQTNVNFNLYSSYSLSDIYDFVVYRIQTLSFSSSLYWDFLYPRNDNFNMSISTSLWFDPYWKLDFSTSIRNTHIYRYLDSSTSLYNEPQVGFVSNFIDSINIFNYEGLKRGYFKLQGITFGLTHYLNEWTMTLNFGLNRISQNALKIAYWEPSIRIEFKLDGTSDSFPPYYRKFVPKKYGGTE